MLHITSKLNRKRKRKKPQDILEIANHEANFKFRREIKLQAVNPRKKK